MLYFVANGSSQSASLPARNQLYLAAAVIPARCPHLNKGVQNPKNFRVVNLLMLTVAGIINAFGITIFLPPVKLYDSGISGTYMLLEQITPPYLSLSFFLLLLNIPLFLSVWKNWAGFLLPMRSIRWRSTLFSHGWSRMSFLLMSVLPLLLPARICCSARCLAAWYPVLAVVLRSVSAVRWTALKSWQWFSPNASVLQSEPLSWSIIWCQGQKVKKPFMLAW